MSDSNVHWLQPSDYEHRFVRPMQPLDMARATRDQDNVDLYSSLEEQERINRIVAESRRDARIVRWQVRIAFGAYAVAVFTACYFALQFVRDVL